MRTRQTGRSLVRIMVQLGAGAGVGPLEAAVAPYILEPLYPGSTDRWFSVTVPDPAEADRIASRLRTLDGVEAAYVEPMSAPPG